MTLTITALTRTDNGFPPAAVLTVEDSVNDASAVSVTRVHADGSRHKVLTGINPQLSGGLWAGSDYCLPYGQPITYEATVNGVTATSSQQWVMSARAWLIHPSSPHLSVRVADVRAIPDRTRQSRASRFQPLPDPDNPDVITTTFVSEGVRNGLAGTLTVKVPVADETRVDALLADDGVVLINTPGSTGWDLKWLWVQPKDVAFQNYVGIKSYPFRNVQIPFEQVADPDVDVAPLTYDDSLLIGDTYAITGDVFATYADLATNTMSTVLYVFGEDMGP